MKKQIKMVNRVNKKQLYNSIMESVIPEIKKALKESEDVEDADKKEEDNVDEAALNELFGFGSSVKKPEKTLSLENTDDENADLFIAWCAYFMSQAGNNVKKGLEAFAKQFGEIVAKAPMMIVKGILKLMSGAIKGSVFGVATIAAVVLGGISMLVKLVASGAEKAKEALTQLYNTLKQGIETFYKNFSEGTQKFATDSKDKLTVWCGVLSGALMAVANKIEGAVEALGEFFKKVLNDAKEKKDAAVLLAKTWLQAKSEAVKSWINQTASDIRKTVIDAWNAIDKKVRSAYNNVASKLEDWMNDIKELISYAGEKIADAAKATKDFAIDSKDKALVWGIQKGVKGLSAKYTEDQVVALVRKCYNESVVPVNGKFAVNEKYFYNAATRKRMSLNESRRAPRRKMLK